MPEFAHFPLSEVRKVFQANGIFAVEDFSDGQTIWGTSPKSESAYSGVYFTIGSEYKPGTYDIFTIRKIVEHLKKDDALQEIEDYLFSHMLKEPSADD